MIERREYRIYTPWVIYASEMLTIVVAISLLSWITGFYVFFSIVSVVCFIRRTESLLRVLRRQRNLKEGFHMKKFWER